MAYQVIARKWRPQSFEEVTGQEPITRTLRGAIEHERLHHAYLFSGARGVGKTTTARLLAKALNCHRAARPTPAPCRTTDEHQCPSCREIAEGRSIDVLEIDAASNTGVDSVRESIINTVGVRPARDRYKVFIIDEVHMLSGAAFNALLKTLEEPPPRVVFIMATTESHKLPDTILSRCQQFEFRTIAATRIMERLRLIADAEKIKVADEALREIARAGEGSMRDAQSAFDQVISFSGEAIGVEDVETALGIASAELRARVMRAVAEQSPAVALQVVDELVMRGHDLRNFCRDLLSHLRDLLVVKVAAATGLADLTEAERGELARAAEAFNESDLVRFFHSLTETEKLLRESAHPRYQLEIGLVKLIEMRRLAPLGQILERLNALEESLRSGHAPTPAGSTGTVPSSSTPPASTGSSHAPARRQSSATEQMSPATPISSGLPEPGAGTGDPHQFEAHGRDELSVPEPAHTPPFEPLPPRRPPAPPQVKSIPTLPATKSKPVSTLSPNAPATAAMSNEMSAATNLKLVPPTVSLPPPAPSAYSSFTAPYSTETPDHSAPSFFDALSPLREDRSGLSLPGGAAVSMAPSVNNAPSNEPLHTENVVSSNRQPEAARGTTGDTLSRLKKALDARRKPFLVTMLEGARLVRLESEELYVEFAPEGRHLRDMLAKPDNVKILREAYSEVAEREVGVQILVRDAAESIGEGSGAGDMSLTKQDEERLETQQLREMAEQHPSVKQLLKTFRGEIIDVRLVEPEGT